MCLHTRHPRARLPCTQHGLATASVSTEALLPAEGPIRKGHGCAEAPNLAFGSV